MLSPSETIEQFEDRNISSSVCRSTPNGINNVVSQLNNCTTTVEQNRNNNLGNNMLDIKRDIESLRANVGDSLLMGDSMFGNFGHINITNQIRERNNELKRKKDELMKGIDKKEAIIERTNRDFSDVKDSLPEKQSNKVLHFIEDYTLAFLSISYLFMIIGFIYFYTISSTSYMSGFFQSFVGSIIITVFVVFILYYLC
jgi:hypothetical protein